jgi:integrase
LLATLVFAGLRIGELTALRWRDVDLAGNRLTIGASKTDAGMRQIDLLPVLRDELTTYKSQAPNTCPDGFVFAIAAGAEPIQGNIRRRMLDKAVAKANEKLIEAGDVPLPERSTPGVPSRTLGARSPRAWRRARRVPARYGPRERSR